MSATTLNQSYRSQEYLAFAETARERYEYSDREIRLMPSGTPNHKSISGNFLFLLKLALRSQPYKIFPVNQRLWISAKNIYTYPDLIVTHQPIKLKSDRIDTVINPWLIAEVRSKSTRNYDYGEKFPAYGTMGRLQDYLLMDKYQIQIDHCTKPSQSQWLLTVYNASDLNSISRCVGYSDQNRGYL
ncbi:Uma2 family endonuclease [Pseudocalidococcus azoricus]|nr:Uma2 family endonuclease [Pseudocalidococcus azoricus]